MKNTAIQSLNEPSIIEKSKIWIQDWFNKLDISTSKMLELLAYFGVGFFVGFLLKKYFKYIFIAILILALSLFVLQNINVVSIDWMKIRQITGVSPEDTIGSLFQVYLEWVKQNILIISTGFVGLLIGYKIG